MCVSEKKRQKPSGAYSHQTPQTMKIAIIIMCVSCESLCVEGRGRWHFLFIRNSCCLACMITKSYVLLSFLLFCIWLSPLLLCFTLPYLKLSFLCISQALLFSLQRVMIITIMLMMMIRLEEKCKGFLHTVLFSVSSVQVQEFSHSVCKMILHSGIIYVYIHSGARRHLTAW